jgi:hypothetical protein
MPATTAPKSSQYGTQNTSKIFIFTRAMQRSSKQLKNISSDKKMQIGWLNFQQKLLRDVQIKSYGLCSNLWCDQFPSSGTTSGHSKLPGHCGVGSRGGQTP